MTDRKSLAGVLPILVTPFDDDGRLDEESLRNLAEFFIARGCHGLTVLGIAGEVHKLSDAERQRVIEVVVDQARGPGTRALRLRWSSVGPPRPPVPTPSW
jgi:dihydrodipicolinate synthase/N-acetylneuraminate lyase